MKKLDKINELLKAMGISEEACTEFTAVCEDWHTSEKTRLQEEYTARLAKAKEVCVEEVESHKAALSRGVKTFLENNNKIIRKASEKNAAIAESEAIDKLSKINAMLNDIDVDGAVNAQALQVEGKKNAELTEKVATLTESLGREKAKAAKMGELAEKSVARQRGLEVNLTENKKLLSEAHRSLTGTKSRKSTAAAISEAKVAPAKSTSTKKVVSESDKSKEESTNSGSEMDIIAESIDSFV